MASCYSAWADRALGPQRFATTSHDSPALQSPYRRHTAPEPGPLHWATPDAANGAGQRRSPPAVDLWYWRVQSQSRYSPQRGSPPAGDGILHTSPVGYSNRYRPAPATIRSPDVWHPAWERPHCPMLHTDSAGRPKAGSETDHRLPARHDAGASADEIAPGSATAERPSASGAAHSGKTPARSQSPAMARRLPMSVPHCD